MRNVEREGFSACMECRGSEDYEFDKNNPELCKCGTSPLEVNIGTKDVVNMDEINDCMKNLRVKEAEVKDLIQPKVKNLCDGMKKMVVADVMYQMECGQRTWSTIPDRVSTQDR